MIISDEGKEHDGYVKNQLGNKMIQCTHYSK